jgi:hypothetical protein
MDSLTAAIIRGEAERQAASGHHLAALHLLDRIPRTVARAETALLRARVLSQQGQFAKAVESWQEAATAAPGSAEAAAGLDLARRLARTRIAGLHLHARRWALALFLLVAVLLAWRAFPARGIPSTRELADSLKRVERSIATSDTDVREHLDVAARRAGQTDSVLLNQARANRLAVEQMRVQMRALQKRVDRTATQEQLQSVRTDILESLDRAEKASPDAPGR